MAAMKQSTVLQETIPPSYNENVDRIRLEEYPTLRDTVYLDHAGTTPYPKSLIERFSNDLTQSLFGNPHSTSASSQLSTRRIEDVRLRALRFFNADPDHYDLVFVANATAGIKLVAECFREQPGGFWFGYHRDAHTSLVGAREHAVEHRCFGHDVEVNDWMQDVKMVQTSWSEARLGLYGYPAQSNLNGRRLSLSWPGLLRSACSSRNRIYSLLDAAALVSTSALDLNDPSQAPDFTVLSFYKIFGFPDLGALIIRKESSTSLRCRRYFGGGTVEMVTCMDESWHVRKQNNLHEQLEDGTLPIHSILALDSAFDVHARLFGSLNQISAHTMFLASRLHRSLSSLRHANGSLVCALYKDPESSYDEPRTQGPIVALNLRSSRGEWISNAEVEKLAAIRNIQFRSGGLCNPGGVAASLDLAPWEMKRNFSAGQRCGNENDILGRKPTGVIRLSLGATNNLEDITAFVRFVEEFFIDRHCLADPTVIVPDLGPSFYVDTLTIYPIKSCGGWQVPPGLAWDINQEGLALDREWCLVHQGTRAALSQKRMPRMALIRPNVDLAAAVLRVRYEGPLPPSVPAEITVPLSADALRFQNSSNQCNVACSSSRVCGDSIVPHVYTSPHIAAFFTAALSTPCTLARFPSGPSNRHSKLQLRRPKPETRLSASTPSTEPSIPGAFPPTPPPSPGNHAHPLLLSNESPILTISRSSLDHLQKLIPDEPPPASVFRANIILAQQAGTGPAVPYDEDRWIGLSLQNHARRTDAHHHDHHHDDNDDDDGRTNAGTTTQLDVLGPCRRCQMVCIDQTTAERREEPFVTLAKTRRRDGEGSKVFFGVHCALAPAAGQSDGTSGGRRTIRVGDAVEPVRRRSAEEE
ncbi:MAG: hypothetical protein LQ344_003042 [Seirophora lacunosa]|nr:MAG: hypothetical protein LQ344_003042 [Seirophora lacunosa]